MIALHSGRALVIIVAAVFLTLVQAVGASAAPADLIESTPTSVAIDAPAPGESQSWNMSVRNVVDSPLPLGLEISGQSDVLFSGPTPVELSVKTSDGATVVERVAIGEVLGRSLALPELKGGASYNLIGTVTLPREAGNSYQGAGGTLKFRFVSSVDRPSVAPIDPVQNTPAAGPGLAYTGLNNLLPVAAAAAALLAVGAGLLLIRRKNSAHE